MKKYLRIRKKKQDTEVSSARITNETVAEHREQVLAGGRRFKYPRQYQKHKLVINSIIISILAVVALVIFSWYRLYVAQDTGELLYRMTRLVPVSVAVVDGQDVRYSDYLSRYRSTIYYYEKYNNFNISTADGKRQDGYIRRQDLTKAEKTAFAQKLAKKYHVTVTTKEVNDFINADITAQGVSLTAYERTVIQSYYGWSIDEYKDFVRASLLKQKVSFLMDEPADTRIKNIRRDIVNGGDFATIAKNQSDDSALVKANGGDTGVLQVTSQDTDGLIAAAKNLQSEQVSNIIKGVDAYYVIKLISKDANTVHFLRIKVALTEFEKQFDQLKKDGKIKEYITVQDSQTQVRQ